MYYRPDGAGKARYMHVHLQEKTYDSDAHVHVYRVDKGQGYLYTHLVYMHVVPAEKLPCYTEILEIIETDLKIAPDNCGRLNE